VREFTVEVQPREQQGSSIGRRLRRQGLVPCVMYHREESSTLGSLSDAEFTKIASRSRPSQVFTLKSSLSAVNGRSALVKEIQKESISNKLLHVDFQLLKDNEEIRVPIALSFTGEAFGVKNDGGILTIALREVTLICLPKNIPDGISVDVSGLKVGDNIHAHQLALPAGVKLQNDPDETVVSVVAQKAMETEPVAAAAVEGDAAAATAEGAAPAAGADAKAADPKAEKAGKDEKKK
jgi:large subunit ribosomal protein L25